MGYTASDKVDNVLMFEQSIVISATPLSLVASLTYSTYSTYGTYGRGGTEVPRVCYKEGRLLKVLNVYPRGFG